MEDLTLFDKIFFALEQRFDVYLEKHNVYKQIKRKLKDAKGKLE